jgi:hypothetical protein
MQPDVEQQEHDAEFGQQVRRLALGDEAKRVRPDHHAGSQIADDRAEPERAHQRDGEDADEKQEDDRRERVHFSHRFPNRAIARRAELPARRVSPQASNPAGRL